MKKSKFTKFLPAVLALMLMSPAAFAAATNTDSSTMTINVPEFINITKKDTSVEAARATFSDAYDTITLDATMNAIFEVITNKPGDKIKVSATALADGSQVDALYGTSDSALNIVFTNIESGREATAAAVQNIMTTPAKKDNANAIAFSLTPTISPDTETGAATPTAAYADNAVEYTLQNGVYEFGYAVGTNAVANTFSTHDTYGTYKATLTLSQVKP